MLGLVLRCWCRALKDSPSPRLEESVRERRPFFPYEGDAQTLRCARTKGNAGPFRPRKIPFPAVADWYLLHSTNIRCYGRP
jgi:hypothetical protein